MKTSFDKESNIIVVYAELKGKKNTIVVKMALDTGTSFTIIPWDIAEKLGFDPKNSPDKVLLTTGSGQEDVPRVTIPLVTALGKKAKNLEVVVMDLPKASHVDSLLGLNFLCNRKLVINFKKGIIDLK